MSDRVLVDLGADGPDCLYICLPDRIILVVNSHVARAAG